MYQVYYMLVAFTDMLRDMFAGHPGSYMFAGHPCTYISVPKYYIEHALLVKNRKDQTSLAVQCKVRKSTSVLIRLNVLEA